MLPIMLEGMMTRYLLVQRKQVKCTVPHASFQPPSLPPPSSSLSLVSSYFMHSWGLPLTLNKTPILMDMPVLSVQWFNYQEPRLA